VPPELSVPVPSVLAPSLKVIVPVALTGAIEADSVTDWPNVEGFGEALRVVVVGTWLTAWVSAEEVLVR
jgi:hypothetical protein